MFFGSLNCGFEIPHWIGKAEPVGFDQCFFQLSDPIFFAFLPNTKTLRRKKGSPLQSDLKNEFCDTIRAVKRIKKLLPPCIKVH